MALAAALAPASNAAVRAPNVVPIHATLVTSGQPGAEGLAELKAEGFEAVEGEG